MFKTIGVLPEKDKRGFAASTEALQHQYQPRRLSNAKLSTLTRVLLNFRILHGQDALTVAGGTRLPDKAAGVEVVFLVLVFNKTIQYADRFGSLHEDDRCETYPLVVVELNRDYGQAVMRPERLADKVAELFSRNEVDFEEHPQFSRRYYVLSEDETVLRNAVTWEFLNTISLYSGLVIEIRGKTLAATTWKRINPESSLMLTDFGFSLLRSGAGTPGHRSP